MAKFNGNIYKEMNQDEQEKEIIKVIPMLQEMMTEVDLNKMREDYHNIKDASIPFWKFVFDNIEVKYNVK
jgi:hypothetical protein